MSSTETVFVLVDLCADRKNTVLGVFSSRKEAEDELERVSAQLYSEYYISEQILKNSEA